MDPPGLKRNMSIGTDKYNSLKNLDLWRLLSNGDFSGGLIHQTALKHFRQHFLQLGLAKDISSLRQNDCFAYFQWLPQQWFLLGVTGLDSLAGLPSVLLSICGMHANSWPITEFLLQMLSSFMNC